jgi:hypothetical protein
LGLFHGRFYIYRIKNLPFLIYYVRCLRRAPFLPWRVDVLIACSYKFEEI